MTGTVTIIHPCETLTVTSKHPAGLRCNCCETIIGDHLVTVDEPDGRFYYCSGGCALTAGHWETPDGSKAE